MELNSEMSFKQEFLRKEIISIVKTFLESNNSFKLSTIIPYINAHLSKRGIDVNHAGIKKVLQSLLKQKIIVKGSKLTKKDILRNKKRRRIYQHIRENPGIIYNKLLTGLDISNYEVYWHLNMLKKFGFVQMGKVQGHTTFYAIDSPPNDLKVEFLKNRKSSKKILDYLRKNNIGVTKTQISEDLSMHFNTVVKYLKLLEDSELITREKISNKHLYFLNN